ncbi:MAG: glutamate racemase [Chitinophagaceae bacterium]|nr:glutamate racemase [Chitinophagaceae bacterium]
MTSSPIGIFDSGYGGLTVMREIVRLLPSYDYLYLGDNARAPYGPRSFETVYRYTLEAVNWFFAQGCPLVILACNTASAKALRTIQQHDLPEMDDPGRRVLGVIRPTAEVIGQFSRTRNIGVLGTAGTVSSESYPLEIHKFFPDIAVYQQACPMWVPLVENREYDTEGADYFIRKCLGQLMAQSEKIDTVLLACTHYPLLMPKILRFLPDGVSVLSQGDIVAKSLVDYLRRHPEMESRISWAGSIEALPAQPADRKEGAGEQARQTGGSLTREGHRHFFTTDSTEDFDRHASIFFGEEVRSEHVNL